MCSKMFVTNSMPEITAPVRQAVSLHAEPGGLEIMLSPCGVPVKEIRLTWQLDTSGYTKILSDAWGVTAGTLGWKKKEGVARAEWYFALAGEQGVRCFGVKTGCSSFCSWLIEPQRITLICDVKNGGEGVELTQPLLCAVAVSMEGAAQETVYQTLRSFCGLMCEKPRLPGRPVYGCNNWYSTYGDITRASVLRDAELCALLASGRPDDAPMPYMLIDDGWAASRVPGVEKYGPPAFNGGPYAPNADFGDMKLVAEEVQARGCLPGIWIRPLCVRAELCPQMPQEFYSENQDYARSEGTYGSILDPSVAGVREYVFDLVRRLSDSGYCIIKHDFTCPDFMGNDLRMPEMTRPGWHLHDRSKTNAQVLLALYQTIQDAANGALVIGCNTYNHLAAGIHEIQRSGCDVSGVDWNVTRRNGINCLIHRLCQNRTFFLTDADCAAFTSYVPTEKNLQFAELIARCNSTLFVSAVPDVLTARDIDRLIEIFRCAAMEKNAAEPVDWMERAIPEEIMWNGQLYRYDWNGQQGR